MACANCGTERTIKAHLIPQAFAREVRGEDTAHALTNGNLSSFQPSQNGRFDDTILCADCDNALGRDEKYAVETLARIRKAAPHIVDRTFEVEGIDGDRLLRFAMAIVWKYALTKPHYGRIAIGPYAERLRQSLYGSGSPDIAVDAFMMKLHSGDDEPYFYRVPLLEKYHGMNFARFSVGGFIFLLKLDQRRPPSPPKEAWLRGNTSIMIPAMRYDQITEGRMVLGARKDNERLDAFLERVSSSARPQ